jgi:RimJ/RimL family protein N-acetyltransferase
MNLNSKPFDNFENLDCGGFMLTGVTDDFQFEAAAMVLATKNKDAQKYLDFCPSTFDEGITRIGECIISFHEKKSLTFVLKLNGSLPVGFIHVHTPDNSTDIKDWLIEYYLNHDHWGKGIMTIAVNNILAFLQINHVENINAIVDEENLGSRRILEKLGFRLLTENKSMNKLVYARRLK